MWHLDRILLHRIDMFDMLPNGSRFPKAPGFECIATTNSASPRANPVRFSPWLKHGSANVYDQIQMNHQLIMNAINKWLIYSKCLIYCNCLILTRGIETWIEENNRNIIIILNDFELVILFNLLLWLFFSNLWCEVGAYPSYNSGCVQLNQRL